MSKTTKLSVEQYAAKFGAIIPKSAKSPSETITRQAILYRIQNGIELPYVTECVKVGRSYVLTVNN